MQTLLLLTDCEHGKQHQLIEVEDSKVIPILAKRQALHATPLVRKRFEAEIIKAHSPLYAMSTNEKPTAKKWDMKHAQGIMTHPSQWKLWNCLNDGSVTSDMTLMEIAEKIGVDNAQLVLHHLSQLQKKGYVETGYWKGERFMRLTDRLPPELLNQQ